MQCAFCKETIDDDSLYCDMCGEEIKTCLGCKKPGKGKVCTACGKPLVSLKSQTGPLAPGGSLADLPTLTPAAVKVPEPALAADSTYRLQGAATTKSTMPQLRIINRNINVDLRVDDNTIIGRSAGQHVVIFGGYKQVSGEHCRFNYDPAKGWSVTDLGSTNKTQYNNKALVPNIPQVLSDKAFLKIANIEFFVQIIAG